MNNETKLDLLWVDDGIAGLSAFVKALENAGFAVTTADSTTAAVGLAKLRPFSLCLVDLNMPSPDGVECLRQLRSLLPGAKLAALSGYLYLARYQAELHSLPFEVELLDKGRFVAPTSPGFEDQFIAPVRRLATEGVTTTIRTQADMVIQMGGRNPFEIPLAEFSELPLLVKDQMRIQAGKIARKVLDRAFADGKLWVMLCGDSSAIRASATSPTELWDEERIMEFGVAQQRVPFIFWNDTATEDIDLSAGWRPCGGESGLAYYPTVTLEFQDRVISVHFDTGSPMTFFSYEELIELEWMRPTDLFGLRRRKGAEHAEYWAALLHIHARLRCQRSGQTSDVLDIRGQAVRDWEHGPFARFCSGDQEACPAGARKGQLCPDRKALVGRNLLIENALVLVLDGKNRMTTLPEK
jgi:CheY-like chemotaxis protein